MPRPGTEQETDTSKNTSDRWKKHLLIGKEQLSSCLCSAHVCAIRKKNPENLHCDAHRGQDLLLLHSARLQA